MSSSFVVADALVIIVMMLFFHAVTFDSGKLMSRRLVSSVQPNMVLISSIRPSACSFFIDRRSSRGRGSCLDLGRPMVWSASGTDVAARLALLPKSGQTGMLSSMNTSTIPLSFRGSVTSSSAAWVKGMLLSNQMGVGIKC